mmetsp:Transcript_7444/g.11237  ORF Transcript_7444/g.11237 Transcript_7444/m.11237 type:complete len:144 (+) Transcript_7444:293-724(+)
MQIVVHFLYFLRLFRASCTIFSLSLSKALVASSSSRTAGFFTTARAMAILCFCPPLSMAERSPTSVLYPCSNDMMKSCAFAALAAATTSASLAPGLPYRMFSLMVPVKSTGSWPTYPIWYRSHCTFILRVSWPSNKIWPCSGS